MALNMAKDAMKKLKKEIPGGVSFLRFLCIT